MAQTLSQIKALLAAHGLRPRRSWGQNFLHDHNKLAAILDAAAVQTGDRVLEVGPGTGTLTAALLEAGARVTAVEIDPGLYDILRDQFGEDNDRWCLIHGDVLDGKHCLNPQMVSALSPEPGTPYPFKLIANLPYQIASPLLINLCADWPTMKLAVVMIQREVADRITATGGKEYGPLSVMVQAMCTAERIAALPPSCFWPKPKVDSAVIRLVRRPRPLTDDPQRLARFCQTLFSKRRKQLGTILGRHFAFPADIDPTLRPEQLSVLQIMALMDATRETSEGR